MSRGKSKGSASPRPWNPNSRKSSQNNNNNNDNNEIGTYSSSTEKKIKAKKQYVKRIKDIIKRKKEIIKRLETYPKEPNEIQAGYYAWGDKDIMFICRHDESNFDEHHFLTKLYVEGFVGYFKERIRIIEGRLEKGCY